MANAKDLRIAAQRGFLGHSALLDPDAYVASIAPQISELGPMVAQNTATNELGFSDQMKVNANDLKPVDPAFGMGKGSSPAAKNTNVRSREQADLNERLLQQGFTPEQVLAQEKNK